ncbi:hypothetical protein Leryth_008539 [Lithospermum erythrorhizon]|nr:hypothetical protein Leryth_008539 [Lithospermum erythrorhizon]
MASHKHKVLPQIEVSITKKISVCSKSTHPSNILELSNLDRQFPDLMYAVFLYKNKSNNPCEISNVEHFAHLQGALEEVLSIWYPAAGRFVNPSDGKLNIICNNAGVVLVDAFTISKISDIFVDPNGAHGLSLHNNGSFENLVFKPENGSKQNIEDMPLLVAQVTKFFCGGYSLGIGVSHSLFDAKSGCEFLCAWASQFHMSRNNVNQLSSLKQIVHERGKFVIANNFPSKMSSIGDQESSGVAAIDHLFQMIKENGVADNQGDYKTDENGSCYVAATFSCTYEMIQRLKNKVAFEGGEDCNLQAYCSSFEVLAAQLWKAKTRVLGQNKEKMVCLQFAVDVRNKMDLSSSSSSSTLSSQKEGETHFSGNAFVLASVSLTAKEVEEQSYEFIIKKIREAKNSVTLNYVNAYIHILEHQGSHTSNISSQGRTNSTLLQNLKGLTIVSDWTKLSYKNINFFGDVAYASPLDPPISQVVYFLPRNTKESSHNGGGTSIDVKVNLLPETQDAFAKLFFLGLQ